MRLAANKAVSSQRNGGHQGCQPTETGGQQGCQLVHVTVQNGGRQGCQLCDTTAQSIDLPQIKPKSVVIKFTKISL